MIFSQKYILIKIAKSSDRALRREKLFKYEKNQAGDLSGFDF